jgi:hypothetical protein
MMNTEYRHGSDTAVEPRNPLLKTIPEISSYRKPSMHTMIPPGGPLMSRQKYVHYLLNPVSLEEIFSR